LADSPHPPALVPVCRLPWYLGTLRDSVNWAILRSDRGILETLYTPAYYLRSSIAGGALVLNERGRSVASMAHGYLTKYELAHLVGIRALQLEQGEFPASLIYSGKDIGAIAEEDVLSGRSNLAFQRPSGDIWRVLAHGRCELVPPRDSSPGGGDKRKRGER
jgi:DNA-directed RNA polymerase subunit K/omega